MPLILWCEFSARWRLDISEKISRVLPTLSIVLSLKRDDDKEQSLFTL